MKNRVIYSTMRKLNLILSIFFIWTRTLKSKLKGFLCVSKFTHIRKWIHILESFFQHQWGLVFRSSTNFQVDCIFHVYFQKSGFIIKARFRGNRIQAAQYTDNLFQLNTLHVLKTSTFSNCTYKRRVGHFATFQTPQHLLIPKRCHVQSFCWIIKFPLYTQRLLNFLQLTEIYEPNEKAACTNKGS